MAGGNSAGHISLVFSSAGRPDTTAIHAFAEGQAEFSVGNGQVREYASPNGSDAVSLELVAHGLTFDLFGLAPGSPAELPDGRHQFDLPNMNDLRAERLEAITIVPGPHLKGGEATLPVARTTCWLAAQFADLPSLRAISWHAAGTWLSPAYFASSVTHWLEGGPFPGLGLTALKSTPDGGLQSDGLSFFIKQELRIEPELVEDNMAGTRLAARLIDYLVGQGRVKGPTDLQLPSGQKLFLEPSGNGRFARVWRR